MRSSIWGPTVWSTLHFLSFHFDGSKEQQLHFRAFLEHLSRILPCSTCQTHMIEYLGTVDWNIALASKESCMRFIWAFHNQVNQRLGKPPMEFTDMIDMYQAIINRGYWNPLADRQQIRSLSIVIVTLAVLCLCLLAFVLFTV